MIKIYTMITIYAVIKVYTVINIDTIIKIYTIIKTYTIINIVYYNKVNQVSKGYTEQCCTPARRAARRARSPGPG